MKKILSLLIALAMAFALVACGSSSSDSSLGSGSAVADASVSADASVEEEPVEDASASSEPADDTSSIDDVDLSSLGTDNLDSCVEFDSLDGYYVHEFEDDPDDWVQSCKSYVFSDLSDEDSGLSGFIGAASSNQSVAMYGWTSSIPASEYAYLTMQGDSDAADKWSSFRDLLVALSANADTWLSLKYDDYHAVVVLLNENDTSNTILAAYNGEIIYDVTTYDAGN